MKLLMLTLGALAALATADVYFKETFGDGWESRWVQSTAKGSDAGKFKLSAGKWFADKDTSKGIQTSQDAKFYDISAKFDKSFSNEGKTLVIQFQVKHEQKIDCGGGYIKIFPSGLDQSKLDGESPYNIMFGPDICGYSTKKVHVIFSYKGENKLIKKTIACKDDELSHVYTLIVGPDNTYEVRIDGSKVESGKLEDDWDFLAPKEIKDPAASKPSDWDDRAKIPDPDDKKPDDWDKPQHIPDPNAEKPDDWDVEMDGEWEPPLIDNPDYKGEWKPREIDNPDYKGVWVHPMIANPDYKADPNLYKYDDHGAIGIDVWQVKSGTIFDNIIITDEVSEAEAFMKSTFDKDAEEAAKKAFDDAEKLAKEAEEKAKEAADDDEGDDEDDEDSGKDEL